METLDFLQLIYSNEEGYLEVMFMWPDGLPYPGERRIQSYWYLWPEDFSDLQREMVWWQHKNNKGFGVHQSAALHGHFVPEVPCPRHDNKPHLVRPCDDSVRVVPALWADFDHESKAICFERLQAFEHLPTVVVDSGGGLHAYWRLDPPMILEGPEDRHRLKNLLKGLATHLETGDRSVSNASRTMRLPGFINTKPKRNGARCKVIDVQSVAYRAIDFAPYAPKQKRPRTVTKLPDDLKKRLPPWVKKYLKSGAPEGERNNRLFAAARAFNDNRFTRSEAAGELEPRAMADGLLKHEIDGVLDSAFSYTPGEPYLPRGIVDRLRSGARLKARRR